MIDFSDCPVRNKTYTGANGNKISILYEGELYMLKFAGPARANKNLSYANGPISEYIGCHVFESLGIPTQKTLLGIYRSRGKNNLVVACKDFAINGLVLQDFGSLKNALIDSSQSGYGTELKEIEQAILEEKSFDSATLMMRFWDVFIVDALIGNWNRHNGNWGFLYNPLTDELTLAPVFDCGSSLFPQADEKVMEEVLHSASARNVRIFERPLSSIKENGAKINYHSFISSLKNDNCNLALLRIQPKIDLGKINEIIDETPSLTSLQRDFYKTMLKERKEKILDFAYRKLTSFESARP